MNGEMLTIDELENISSEDLAIFKKDGICLIKIPEQLHRLLQRVKDAGDIYFNKPSSEKEKNLFTSEHREGYLNQVKNNYSIERYINRGTAPSCTDAPLNMCSEEIQQIREQLKKVIALPLLKAIFSDLDIELHYETVTKEPDYTLSLIYYPADSEGKLRLQPHKDTILITILWVTSPGFEAIINGKWQAVNATQKYVIAQAGEALEVMTNNECRAVEHRVTLPMNTSRLSIAMFFGPNDNILFKNYKTGTIINEKFGNYVKEHVARTYDKGNLDS